MRSSPQRGGKKMEEEKREEAQRVTVELKHGDYQTHTVLFAAGMALLTAWLKRAIMVILVEQWRAWVFLALNLILLAIVFTSAHPSAAAAATAVTATPSDDEETNENRDKCTNNCSNIGAAEKESKRRKPHCKMSEAAQVLGTESGGCGRKIYRRRSSRVESERVEEGADSETRGLSKEELNERVEAFITMFRQHLVLDAIKGRS